MPTPITTASQNPVKLTATRTGYQALFGTEPTVEGVSVPSGVADQPMTDAETLLGAVNRVHRVRELRPASDFWVGIEGGLEESDGDLVAFAWVVVLGASGAEGRSRTASFALPPGVAELVRSGLELGEADDRVFGRSNSKQKDGAVGLLSDGAMNRCDLYRPAVTLAFLPFKKPELYGAI